MIYHRLSGLFNEERTAYLEHCNRERMHEVVVWRKNNLTILSIKVRSEYDVKFSINPKQTIAVVIYNTNMYRHYEQSLCN